MRTALRPWSRLLPLLTIVCLLTTGLSGTASALSPHVLTAPVVNSVWLAGSSMTIQWTDGPPATPVKLALVDVPAWTVVASIAVNIPNTGSYTWTIPANLPTSTYLVYIEAMDQSTWTYGPNFTIQAVDSRPDLTIAKKPGDNLVAGQNATYQVAVTNVGGGPESGPITVTDTLGAGLTFVAATGTGWTCSVSGQVVTCTNPGPLPAGQSLPAIYLTVAVAATATKVENCAEVAAKDDANAANNSTCVPTPVEPAPLGQPCGAKFADLDGNGTWDANEPGLAGWTIQLLDAAGNVVATATTGPGGRYCFQDVPAGSYTAQEVSQTGWAQTLPSAPGTYSVGVGAAYPARTLLFGNQPVAQQGSICGIKFDDKNGNGVQDPGELGLGGWTIQVKDAAGNVVASVVTGDKGDFCFKGLRFGAYTVSEVNQTGWQQTLPAAGSYTVSLTQAQPDWHSLLFGNRQLPETGTVCGVKFEDKNGNGVQDPGELGLGGWTIQVKDAAGNVVATVVTDKNGKFCFGRLRPGSYTFAEVMQSGWQQTFPAAPGTHTVNVVSGQNTGSVDFGNQPVAQQGTICGVKFEDKNGNGKQDPGEPGLGGWTIQITDAAGNVVATVVTRDDGTYCFQELRPGSYTFAEVMQSGWHQTFPGAPGTQTVKVDGGQNAQSVNFGNQKQPEPCCLSFDFLQGRADNYSTAGAPETARPSPALVQLLPAAGVYSDFDGTQSNHFVAHTIYLPAGNCVKSAKLEFKAKPLSYASNDTVSLRFAGVAGSPAWGSYLGSGQPSVGLVANPWVPANNGAGQVISRGPASLPGGANLISTLNAQRFLDFMVQDDTSVDYVRLTVEFCQCAGTGQPVGDSASVTPRVVIRLVVDSSEAGVNGEASRLPAPTVTRDGSTLVPLRWIGEALGAEVQWDPAERRVTYVLGERKVELWIDKKMARVNGEEVSLSIAPTLIEGSTFVPVRFISEALGAAVAYNPDDRSITITYPK